MDLFGARGEVVERLDLRLDAVSKRAELAHQSLFLLDDLAEFRDLVTRGLIQLRLVLPDPLQLRAPAIRHIFKHRYSVASLKLFQNA